MAKISIFDQRELNKQLLRAVEDSKLDHVQQAIEMGAEVNCDNRGVPLLHSAIYYHNMDIIRLLIDKGADIDKCDMTVNSLHIAVIAHNLELVKLLAPQVQHINAQTAYGKTALILIANTNQPVVLEIAKVLLQNNALVDAVDNNGNTPLRNAAKVANLELCELLISEGASVNVTNKFGKTCLNFLCYNASREKYMPVIELLAKSGAVFSEPYDVSAAYLDHRIPPETQVFLKETYPLLGEEYFSKVKELNGQFIHELYGLFNELHLIKGQLFDFQYKSQPIIGWQNLVEDTKKAAAATKEDLMKGSLHSSDQAL